MLQWRRDKVIELRGIGLSYAEIAQQLQVSTSSIGTDVQYLREQAKENIKEYVTQHLPEQYQVRLCALDAVLKNAFVIMTKSEDNREKLAAMELFKDTHLIKLSCSSIHYSHSYFRRTYGTSQEYQAKESKLQRCK
jgi:IS30 family transposase